MISKKTIKRGAPADHGGQPETVPATNRREQLADPGQAKKSEAGGPKGPEPTRYGDWERDGRCVDF